MLTPPLTSLPTRHQKYPHRRLDATLVKNLKRPKAHLSMRESGQFLMKSRYLQYMATLVLGAFPSRV